MNNRVLFICTGNYYRSRYAEILFNDYASRYHLDWMAFSRGFEDSTRPWPISPNAKKRLKIKSIPLKQIRYPIRLSAQDLTQASRIILMDEIEHRPMLTSQYPQWLSRVEFWQIRDVDFESPHSALPKLEERLERLVTDLQAKQAIA